LFRPYFRHSTSLLKVIAWRKKQQYFSARQKREAGMPVFRHRGCLAHGIFTSAIVLAAWMACLADAAAQKVSQVEVGIVVPKDVITGETISAAMVANPKDFAGIAALQVLPAQLPGIPGVNAADLLKQYKIQAGDGAGFVPATGPFSFTAADSVPLRITRADIENAPVIAAKIPLAPRMASPINLDGPGFRIPPITLAGAVHLIRGPLSGDSSQTRISVNGAASKILAESPRGVFCFVPPAIPAGPAEWTIEDSGRRTRLKTWVLALQMSADKLKLMKGESTAFHVFVRGVESIPREAWFGSGSVPELVDPALITKFLPGFKPPSPLQPGVLVLTLENMSAGTVVMSGGNKVALTFGYGAQKYEHHGTITATRAGSFDIDGTLIPFLHDLPGEGLPGDNVPQTAAAIADGLRQRAQQWRGLAIQVQELGPGNTDAGTGENAVRDYNRNGDRLDQVANEVEKNGAHEPPANLSADDKKLIQQLHESADFWHKEAEKARQWARESADDKSRRHWEEEARWDDGNARRREDLIHHMEGKTGQITTQSDPPPPPVPTTPQEPVTVGRGDNPPGHTPSPTPTPTPVSTTEEKKKEEDCPQRGKGCVALIIDFSHNVTWEFDMESLSKKFTAAGCDTDYIAPDLWEIPLPQTYGYEGVASYTTKPDPKEQEKAREHNTPEWKKVRDAIARHREKVAKGVELAVEIVNGHGDGKSGDGVMRCGDWVWKEYSGDFLLRADFHEGNYRAANKNVCGWFTSDFACYGGLTPKVVDELNNLTTSTCSQASTIACGNHAGWEADSSSATATSTETCSNASIGWQKSYIGDPLDAEIDRRKNLPPGSASSYTSLIEALRSKAGESSTSRYADRGYAKDKPPVHARGGYGEESSK
jgi:hypothetical protein